MKPLRTTSTCLAIATFFSACLSSCAIKHKLSDEDLEWADCYNLNDSVFFVSDAGDVDTLIVTEKEINNPNNTFFLDYEGISIAQYWNVGPYNGICCIDLSFTGNKKSSFEFVSFILYKISKHDIKMQCRTGDLLYTIYSDIALSDYFDYYIDEGECFTAKAKYAIDRDVDFSDIFSNHSEENASLTANINKSSQKQNKGKSKIITEKVPNKSAGEISEFKWCKDKGLVYYRTDSGVSYHLDRIVPQSTSGQ